MKWDVGARLRGAVLTIAVVSIFLGSCDLVDAPVFEEPPPPQDFSIAIDPLSGGLAVWGAVELEGDYSGPMAAITLSIDGIEHQTVMSGARWNVQVDTEEFADGSHKATVKGYDQDSALVAEASINVVVRNVSLSSLRIAEAVLSPYFQADTISYEATVGRSTSPITVTATLYNPDTILEIDGVEVSSGSAHPVVLEIGPNDVVIETTAAKGRQRFYALNLTRSIYDPGSITVEVTNADPADGWTVYFAVTEAGAGSPRDREDKNYSVYYNDLNLACNLFPNDEISDGNWEAQAEDRSGVAVFAPGQMVDLHYYIDGIPPRRSHRITPGDPYGSRLDIRIDGDITVELDYENDFANDGPENDCQSEGPGDVRDTFDNPACGFDYIDIVAEPTVTRTDSELTCTIPVAETAFPLELDCLNRSYAVIECFWGAYFDVNADGLADYWMATHSTDNHEDPKQVANEQELLAELDKNLTHVDVDYWHVCCPIDADLQDGVFTLHVSVTASPSHVNEILQAPVLDVYFYTSRDVDDPNMYVLRDSCSRRY